MPDRLMGKARKVMAGRHMTFRALVIDALEKELKSTPAGFQLRNAAAGTRTGHSVGSDRINQSIDDQRTSGFTP